MNSITEHSRARPGQGNPQRIKVLLYHRVVDSPGLSIEYPGTCIHVRDFRQHVTSLERWGYTTITFEDYHFYLEGELHLPKKPVIVTFDDGYADTFENAFPVLQEFGMKAVVFVLGDRRIRIDEWNSKRGYPLAPLIDDYQLLELHRHGFEIGAHSRTHRSLVTLPLHQAWEEISQSRIGLEYVLNAPVRSFSFPYGTTNEVMKRMVEDAGFIIGCGTYSGPPVFGKDVFEIRRTLIEGNITPTRFGLRLFAPYEYYAWLRSKVRSWSMVQYIKPREAALWDPQPVVETMSLSGKEIG